MSVEHAICTPAKAGAQARRFAPIGAAAPEIDLDWAPAFAGERGIK